jgi:ubiquinone/menaquinone biosynthesis C-methylase UbiE
MMNTKAQQFWDKHAKKYDLAEQQFEPVYREIIAKTLTYLDENDQVLDHGCATGNKALMLAPAVKHILGLDISAEMINLANKKKEDADIPNCSFIQGTIHSEDLENSSFDKILSYSVIHLLEDSPRDIQRIYELLRPGGIFISTVACFKEKMTLSKRIEFLLYWLMKLLGILPIHLNLYNAADVENLFVQSHFKIIESEKIFSEMTASFIVAQKPF